MNSIKRVRRSEKFEKIAETVQNDIQILRRICGANIDFESGIKKLRILNQINPPKKFRAGNEDKESFFFKNLPDLFAQFPHPTSNFN